jgi:phosphohistidine phosphatase
MQLYFLRHGLAHDWRAWEGADASRPLTSEGKARMQREAIAIRQLDLKLHTIITSPLVRAQQTAEMVARELRLLDKLVKDERLAPGFNLAQLTLVVQAYHMANALMLVGHEPDFSETIRAVIGGGHIVCKKGSLAYVELYDLETMQGELVWLLPPKMLAGPR